MTKISIKCIIILLFGIISTTLHSQEKYERESRIYVKDVPPDALEFIGAIENPGKVKWYIEYGLENKSIEAKFKLNNKRHSVEFDTLGNIEDVEIEIRSGELQKQLKKKIDSTLSSICTSHKISKIQKQYTGTQSELLSKLKEEEVNGTITTKYEIVAKCVSEGKTEQYEYLFSVEGKLLQQFKIIFKNSSNLRY